MSSQFSSPAGEAFGHFHKSNKNRASGAHYVGKSLCGQGNSPAKTLRLQPLRPSLDAG